MLVKINDVSAMIENFIKASIKSDYPNSDLTGTSSAVDLFIKPMTSISKILMDFSKDIELRSFLSNASEMSREDLNNIGEGNYMTKRSEGTKSFGTVQLKFKTIPEDRALTIPIGTIFSTSSGLRFQVHQTYSLSPEELSLKWSSEDLSYNVDVSVESEEVGSIYNVSSGEINKIESSFTNHSVTVTNNTAFTGGSDEETNEEYRERIEKFISSRTLETAPGYESEIKDNFSEVFDIYVAGYGDPLMERDLVDSVTIDGVTFTDKHLGGKVDIYIRGDNVGSKAISFTALTNRLPLPEVTEKIDQTSISLTNSTTSLSMSDFSIEEDSGNNKYIVVVNVSSEWSYGDVIDVSYDYDSTDDGLYDSSKTEDFTIDEQIHNLSSPVEAISSIINETQNNTFYDVGDGLSGTSDYTLDRGDVNLIGTSGEVSVIEVISSSINNGDLITINYNYNETVQGIKSYFDERENRVVTRDILLKKCVPVYIHIGFDVKLKDGVAESSIIESQIFDIISKHFDDKGLGEKVDESDIVHEIYNDESLSKVVDYLVLGFSTFHKTLNQGDAFAEGVSDGTTIEMNAIDYPVLRYLNIGFIS